MIDLCPSVDNNAVYFSSKPAKKEKESGPSSVHTNDALNQPDCQGRVLVNANHPAAETDIFLSPQLARAVKPHQIGGIRFLYDNLVESLERFGSGPGFGCILAHSMGLGKTLQVISFIDVLFRHTQAHSVLAIVPVTTLKNWLAEFNKWVPPPEVLTSDTDHGLVTPRIYRVHILSDKHKSTANKAKVVKDWARDGGVLLMGYEMYRLLSLKSLVFGRKKKCKETTGPVVIDVAAEDERQGLLKDIEKALVCPGPDVVICDEGHRIKNCHASTSQALQNIRTRRRLVLTGYPLQNNLTEYWCMVDFVRPNFLGMRKDFVKTFEQPILNGQSENSSPQKIQLMRHRTYVLHNLLEGFVQRRGHDVLEDQLQSKEEHVILVRPSPLQRTLYIEFMNRLRKIPTGPAATPLNTLKAFCFCYKIWNHPDLLFETLHRENPATDQDLDLDDITITGPAQCSTNQKSKPPKNPDSTGELSFTSQFTYEWAKDIMCSYKPGILESSPKMVLLFHLIEESVRMGDKLLVFSQSLSTLTLIEYFLNKRPVPPLPNTCDTDGPNKNWVCNLNYYRLDGSTAVSDRAKLINRFNDPSNTSALLFLLSTKAGGLGINLIGANRVVLFDVSWNPCHDAQAVCRIYRYGQRKPCIIYRLVCDFTMEKNIYNRQISKQDMSDRVVDDFNPVLALTSRESLLNFVEEELYSSPVQLQPQNIKESVLRKALLLHPHLITKQPFPHKSLLIDNKELSSAEKNAARKGYEEEKRCHVPYLCPSLNSKCKASTPSPAERPSKCAHLRDAYMTNVIYPNMNATAALFLKKGSQCKASTPSPAERPSKCAHLRDASMTNVKNPNMNATVVAQDLKKGPNRKASAPSQAGPPSKRAHRRGASMTNDICPNMNANATAAHFLKEGLASKASALSRKEPPSKQPCTGKHSSTPLASQGFPYTGGYNLPPLGLNPAVLGSSIGHPLFMAADSPYLQSPQTQLGDPIYMYPRSVWFRQSQPCPQLLLLDNNHSYPFSSSSSPSVKAASLVPRALPPLMMRPSSMVVEGSQMAGMLSPWKPSTYLGL